MVKNKNQYILITTEGETIAPDPDYPIENCQVLGIVEANNADEAIKQIVGDNDWFHLSGFDISKSRCIQVLTDSVRNDIRYIIECLFNDEEIIGGLHLSQNKRDLLLDVLKRLSSI